MARRRAIRKAISNLESREPPRPIASSAPLSAAESFIRNHNSWPVSHIVFATAAKVTRRNIGRLFLIRSESTRRLRPLLARVYVTRKRAILVLWTETAAATASFSTQRSGSENGRRTVGRPFVHHALLTSELTPFQDLNRAKIWQWARSPHQCSRGTTPSNESPYKRRGKGGS